MQLEYVASMVLLVTDTAKNIELNIRTQAMPIGVISFSLTRRHRPKANPAKQMCMAIAPRTQHCQQRRLSVRQHQISGLIPSCSLGETRCHHNFHRAPRMQAPRLKRIEPHSQGLEILAGAGQSKQLLRQHRPCHHRAHKMRKPCSMMTLPMAATFQSPTNG